MHHLKHFQCPVQWALNTFVRSCTTPSTHLQDPLHLVNLTSIPIKHWLPPRPRTQPLLPASPTLRSQCWCSHSRLGQRPPRQAGSCVSDRSRPSRGTSCLSGKPRCSRPIGHSPCPTPGISRFSQEPCRCYLEAKVLVRVRCACRSWLVSADRATK